MGNNDFEKEKLNEDAVTLIKEEYTYLKKVDSYNNLGVKFRRVGAAIFDWVLSGAVLMLAMSVIAAFTSSLVIEEVPYVLMIIIILSFPALFILRDVMWRGRSVGKRVFGLTVIDNKSGEIAKTSQRFVRNLFMFILHIDVLVMLITGRSIGDRVANTAVVSKKNYDKACLINPDEINAEDVNQYGMKLSANKKGKAKSVLLVILIIFLFFMAFYGLIRIVLETAKDSDEYKLAYAYLIESEVFAEAGISEDRIDFRQYNSSTYTDENGLEHCDAELGFKIKGKMYYVICHRVNGEWSICEECTNFE